MTVATSFQNKTEQGKFVLPQLNFAQDSLEPYIDAETIGIHYGKHHQTYINNLNAALEKYPDLQKFSIEEILSDLSKIPQEILKPVKNHGGGHANHSLYWSNLTSPDKSGVPSDALMKAIEKTFGSFDAFKEKLAQTAIGTFGSGWGWLTVNSAKELIIESTSNQDSPLSHGNTPILVIDVWEHAYYLKYQNRRPDHVQAIFNIINWENVSERYSQAIQ